MKKIFSIILSVTALSLSAQNVEFEKDNFKDNKDGLKEAKRSIQEGDAYYNNGPTMYKQALEPYLKANKFNPNNAMLNFKIGKCYTKSPYKYKSLFHLQKALELNPNIDPEIHLYLGIGYHLNMKWEDAITEFKKYQATLDMTKKENKPKIADVTKYIQECLNGIELVKKPVRVFIDNVGGDVNSSFSDYGPVISADESVMMFTSRRSSTTGGGIDENENEFYEDIFVSYRKDGKWTPAQNMGKPINTEGHDATVALSPDAQKLLVYLDDGKHGLGNIYECDLKGEAWTKPDKMTKNINTDYHESSATISSDLNTIYFVSEKPEGMGSRDIYVAQKNKKGEWGPSVNIGPTLNTQYGEEGVFIHPDGKTMYFSSQGHKTMGGYDIFKSIYENGVWSEPENLGYPINTPDDDVFFVISASGKHGYYASFKTDGYGEKDIYMVTFLGPEKPMPHDNEDNLLASATVPVKEVVAAAPVEIVSAAITILKGTITDALTQKVLEAQIDIIDNMKNEVIASFTSNSTTGRYLVSLPAGRNYGIAVKKDGYLFHSENFDIPKSASYQEVVKDVALKNVAVGTKIILRNIFFDFDKATLRPESTNELERLTKLLNDVPSMKIEISGHTDSKGADEYNKKLSNSRAKSVVDYLVSKGISAGRLTFVGYGEEQPIATNDTDEGRQMNRRTEFKITGK